MTQEQITLLRAIPIEDLASRLGLDVRHHKALCPFHNDHHAASSATPTATPSTSSATSSTKTSNKPASTSPTAPANPNIPHPSPQGEGQGRGSLSTLRSMNVSLSGRG